MLRNIPMRKPLLAVLCVLCLSPAWGGELGSFADSNPDSNLELGLPPVRDFTPPDFFSRNRQHTLRQDSRGRIYYAQADTLRIFDGARFRTVPLDGQRSIQCFTLLSDDRLLVARDQDLLLLTPDARDFFSVSSPSTRLPPETRREVFARAIVTCDTLGETIYLNNLRTIYQIEGNQARRIFETESLIPYSFTHEGHLYICTSNRGVLRWTAATEKWESVPGAEVLHDKDQGAVLAHAIGDNGELLLFTHIAGVWRMRSGQVERAFPLGADLIQALGPIHGGTVLKGRYYLETANHGIHVFSPNGKRLQVIDRNNLLRDHDLYELLVDSSDQLWVHSRGGLLRLDCGAPLQRYPDIEGILTENIGLVFRNRGQMHMVSTRRILRGEISPNSQMLIFRALPINERLGARAASSPHGVLYTAGGILWCALDGVIRPVVEVDRSLNAIFASRLEPDIYYVAGPGQMLRVRYDGMTWQTLGQLTGNYAYASSIHETAPGRLYLEVGPGRLVAMDWSGAEPNQVSYDGHDGLPADAWVAPFPHTSGWRFRSAKHGIYRYDAAERRFVRDPTLDGFFPVPLDSINHVGYDSQGLWYSSHEGNGFLTPQPDGSYSTEVLELGDLNHRIINSIHRESESVWIGTNYGLVRHQNKAPVRPLRPLYAVVDRVEGPEFDWQSLINSGPPEARLHAGQNGLRLEYSASVIEPPDSIQFRLSLRRGGNLHRREWSPTPFVEYALLPPGRYDLTIEPRDDRGRVGQPAHYTFRVDAPWWQHPLAWFLWLGAGGALIAGAWVLGRWSAPRAKGEQPSAAKPSRN